jgi:DNA-binding response OmpR family regulator
MSEGSKLLLVDDSDDDAFLFKRALRRHPNVRLVGWAQDGDAAIAYLSGADPYADRRQYPWPDVMVLDLKMPRRDGYEVLKWMEGKNPRPKVAVFTSSDLEEDKRRVGELGADLFQQKVFLPEELDRFIERLKSL